MVRDDPAEYFGWKCTPEAVAELDKTLVQQDRARLRKRAEEEAYARAMKQRETEKYEEEDGWSETDNNGVVDEAVLEDMEKFKGSIRGLSKRFRLIKRIGEGTFSTVYKAEDLLYDAYENDWDWEAKENQPWPCPASKRRRIGDSMADQKGIAYEPSKKRRSRFVAIKKIYVTSSPTRIQNELELLYDLQGCDSVCPLITAFRHQDQVVAVLPYYRHWDFRIYFREMLVPDIRNYFRSLFKALAAVHSHGIIHRDIKPTNFLFDVPSRRGVLVDFGLAEREGTDSGNCICQGSLATRQHRIATSAAAKQTGPSLGYPKDDPRPSRRANRAGTRGFRAPEVLYKCTNQTTKIDIWSAGVILLTILSRRFPFFNSTDDVEALIEIATIFGRRRMEGCALLHGNVLETNIPTIGEKGFSFEKIIRWSTGRTAPKAASASSSSTTTSEALLPPPPPPPPLLPGEHKAIDFLYACMELDPKRRISAQDALEHPFLATLVADDDELVEDGEMAPKDQLAAAGIGGGGAGGHHGLTHHTHHEADAQAVHGHEHEHGEAAGQEREMEGDGEGEGEGQETDDQNDVVD